MDFVKTSRQNAKAKKKHYQERKHEFAKEYIRIGMLNARRLDSLPDEKLFLPYELQPFRAKLPLCYRLVHYALTPQDRNWLKNRNVGIITDAHIKGETNLLLVSRTQYYIGMFLNILLLTVFFGLGLGAFGALTLNISRIIASAIITSISLILGVIIDSARTAYLAKAHPTPAVAEYKRQRTLRILTKKEPI